MKQIPLRHCTMYLLKSFCILGGLIVVPIKHKDPAQFVYNSGFYITTNEYPDFGPGVDGEATRKRLAVFETKALPKKYNKASSEYSRLDSMKNACTNLI